MGTLNQAALPTLPDSEASVRERDELRRLVQAGVESGAGIEATEAFARLRAKFEALAAH